MSKKITLSVICFAASLFVKAQITPIEYPSNNLSEEKITQVLENSRKKGVQEWEIQKQNEILHRQLLNQNKIKANGLTQQKTNLPPPQVMSGCVNPGFETGDITGWTFTQGSNSSGQVLPCPTCFTSLGGVYEVTQMSGSSLVNINAGNTVGGDASATCNCSAADCPTEPYSGGIDRFSNFPVVAPGGGAHSLLLNNSNCGFLMQRASQSFVVDATNSLYTFQYALVLQSGGHPVNESPYFAVNLTDVTTGSVVPCSQINETPPTSGSATGWSISTVDNNVYYKPWQTVNIDLSSIVGHTVTVTFDVSDCDQGGHFGYAYIDANCNFEQITASNPLCQGGSTTLSGPPGMASYSWSGPVNGSLQNLTTSTPGNYTLTTTSATGCSSPTLYYNLTQSSTSSPTVSIQVLKDTICSGTTTTLTATGANTYAWSNSANTSSIVVSPTSNTTYSVTGTDNAGCADTATSKIINVVAHHVTVQATNDSICPGGFDVLTATGANTYVWSNNANSATTNTVSVAPTVNTTYTVVGTNSFGCIDSTSKTIIMKNCGTTNIGQFVNSANQISVYPNPATEMLYIECPFKNSTLYITDIIGNKIKQAALENELTVIDISNLSKGVYFLNVKTAGNIITKKFIVQR